MEYNEIIDQDYYYLLSYQLFNELKVDKYFKYLKKKKKTHLIESGRGRLRDIDRVLIVESCEMDKKKNYCEYVNV